MALRILRSSTLRGPLPARMLRPFTTAHPLAAPQSNPPAAANVRNPIASDPESHQVNRDRSAAGGRTANPDSASTAKPVTNPEGGAMGVGEEPQASREAVMGRPGEPAEVKRERVEKEGGGRKLDAAD